MPSLTVPTYVADDRLDVPQQRPQSQSHSIARWFLLDDKLVCKWFPADL